MLATLTNIPDIETAEVWQLLAHTIYTTIQRTGYAAISANLRQFINSLPSYSQADLEFGRAALEFLYSKGGQVGMPEIAGHCGLSLRQFERRFKQLAGISPKLLARLIRFEAARNALLQGSAGRPNGLAHKFGYTDEAHFIHDFKALAGCSPGKFLKRALERRRNGFYPGLDPRLPYKPCYIQMSGANPGKRNGQC